MHLYLFRNKMSAIADILNHHMLCSQTNPSHGASESEQWLNSAVQFCYIRPTPLEDKCTINAACLFRVEKELKRRDRSTAHWPMASLPASISETQLLYVFHRQMRSSVLHTKEDKSSLWALQTQFGLLRVTFLQNHKVKMRSGKNLHSLFFHRFLLMSYWFTPVLSFQYKMHHNHFSYPRNLLQIVVLLLLVMSVCCIIHKCVHSCRVRSGEGVPPHLFTIRACWQQILPLSISQPQFTPSLDSVVGAPHPRLSRTWCRPWCLGALLEREVSTVISDKTSKAHCLFKPQSM